MTLGLPKRFESKVRVEPDSGCWLWTASCFGGGYAAYWDQGRTRLAHVWAYKYVKGSIAEELQLDHLCRVLNCVNPYHLEPVTQKINTQRGMVGVAHKAMTHCRRGHEFTPENTRADFNRGVWCRQCRTCDKLRAAKKRGKK